jgi:hypothetical protein
MLTRLSALPRSCISLGLLAALANSAGCSASKVVGPLSHEQDERGHLLLRAEVAGQPPEFIHKILPPLTSDELKLAVDQDDSCRSTYRWKNALTYTGSGLIAGAAFLTIGGAYTTGNTDTSKAAFGIAGGTLALFGSMMVALGGIFQNHYGDKGCQVLLDPK